MTELEQKIAASMVEWFPKAPDVSTADGVAAFRAITIEEAGLDSLDSMELVMNVEDTFEVELDEDAVLACETVGQMIDLVQAAVSAG